MSNTEADIGRDCACGPGCDAIDSDGVTAGATQLHIVWQRLVSDEGDTCPRCGTTQAAVQAAMHTLTDVLRPLGIEPTLETLELNLETFEASPLESNRIWVVGESLEKWIGGSVGGTRCCTVCGDNDCRTLELEGTTFEAIPERLIVKAGLAAAATLLPV